MMGRFLRYVEKVFDLGAQMALLRDSRRNPQIPTEAIFLSALMMFVTRLRSLNAMEQHTRGHGRWAKVLAGRAPSAERVGQVAALMDSERLRDMLSGILHRLRRNKALDENPWALRFVALDGHEFFSQ